MKNPVGTEVEGIVVFIFFPGNLQILQIKSVNVIMLANKMIYLDFVSKLHENRGFESRPIGATRWIGVY